MPADVEFATKPELARRMIVAALDAAVPAAWVTGDEVYGADPTLRATLEDRGVGYVLAIASNRRITVGQGVRRVDELTEALPAWSWQRLPAGQGSHGPRMYSWPWMPIPGPVAAGYRWVLVRRNDSMSTRSAVGPPGTVGSPFRSRTPSWSWSPRPNGPPHQPRTA